MATPFVLREAGRETGQAIVIEVCGPRADRDVGKPDAGMLA